MIKEEMNCKCMLKLLLIVVIGSLLVSCGNKKVKVQDVFEDEQTLWGRNAEEIVLEQKEESLSEPVEPVKPTYKEWKLGYATDEFGDEVEDIKYIFLDLDAYFPKYGDTGKGINITYCHNKITGIELLAFSSSQSEGKYQKISFKTGDGEEFDLYGEYRGEEGQNYSGSVVFYDLDDMKTIVEVLNEGNFKIKVGYYVSDVKDETKGFRESVEKYFKGEDIEILLPRITRE